MWSICKKEFSQFFSSLTGMIAIAVFLLLNSLMLFVFPDSNILDFGYATLDQFFDLAPWLLLLLVPAVTMRTLADEFKGGTYELLQTRPLRRKDIVAGKYLGCLAVVVTALLPTIIYTFSVQSLADTAGMDTGATLGSYIGLLFLAAVFTAIGVWSSSFTDNAVVAFILSAFACFLVYSGFNAISRIPAFTSGADYYIEMLGIDFHYKSISRGVIDSRDVLYFLSVICLFLFLTSRHLSRRNGNTGKQKSLSLRSILSVILLIAGVNLLASIFHYRLDLTAEKRYTLSEPTLHLLHQPDDQVTITVFLSGEMPAGFKKLAKSTQELLQEFKENAKANIQYRFERPGAGMEAEAKAVFLDSLQRLGLNPTNVKAQTKEGEGQEERLVYPGALVQYKGRVTAIDLLQGQSAVDGINSLNNAEALLEYKFARAITKLISEKKPTIAYATGNGEPIDGRTYDLVQTLQKDYRFFTFDLNQQQAVPSDLDVLLITKPTDPFTEKEKLKIDQYIMHGGKVIWMIDRLYAEMDSLQRAQNEFIAFDRGLNLDDILFKYGVRINPDLVQSLNSDKFGMVVGSMGGKPQMELLPWPYFPLLQNNSGHPIAKNLDYITTEFPHSIDTVEAEGIRKTILLTTAPESRILNTPAKVMIQSIKTEEDLSKFNQGNIPVAVLLEGKFSSLYTNRLSPTAKDSLHFLPADTADNKMIIIADGDIALNTVSQNEGPLPMGMNRFTQYQYANREFVMNCLEYLTDNSGILEARSKDYTLRLLDKKKIAEQKTTWQLVNIIAPLLLVILFGLTYQAIRKKKYA